MHSQSALRKLPSPTVAPVFFAGPFILIFFPPSSQRKPYADSRAFWTRGIRSLPCVKKNSKIRDKEAERERMCAREREEAQVSFNSKWAEWRWLAASPWLIYLQEWYRPLSPNTLHREQQFWIYSINNWPPICPPDIHSTKAKGIFIADRELIL